MKKICIFASLYCMAALAMDADGRDAASRGLEALERARACLIVKAHKAEYDACKKGDKQACSDLKEMEREYYAARHNAESLQEERNECVNHGTQKSCASLVQVMQQYGVPFTDDLFPEKEGK